MQQMKNSTPKPIGFVALSYTNVQTRLAASALTLSCRVIKSNGTAAAGGGTFTVQDESTQNGQVIYTPAVGDIDTNGPTRFIFKHSVASVMEQVEIMVDVRTYDPYNVVADTASAVWATVIEGTSTASDIVRGMISVLVGPVLDFTTSTLVFKSLNGAKTRWTVTTGTTGRTAVTQGDLT